MGWSIDLIDPATNEAAGVEPFFYGSNVLIGYLSAEGSSVSLASLTQQLQGLDTNINGVKTALDNTPIPTLPPVAGASAGTSVTATT